MGNTNIKENIEHSPLVKSLMETSNRSQIVEQFLMYDELYESTGLDDYYNDEE